MSFAAFAVNVLVFCALGERVGGCDFELWSEGGGSEGCVRYSRRGGGDGGNEGEEAKKDDLEDDWLANVNRWPIDSCQYLLDEHDEFCW